MEVIQFANLRELIARLRLRPGMFIGEKKLSLLRAFLDGYLTALNVHNLKSDNKPVPFWFFHEWVARYYNRTGSAAGWCRIILEENGFDEEKSLDVFFELVERFFAIEILSVQQMELNRQSVDFHYSDQCGTKRITDIQNWTKGPVYETPTAVYLLELSDKSGFVFKVIDGDKTDWEHTLFRTEQKAKEKAASLFGNFSSWKQINKTQYEKQTD